MKGCTVGEIVQWLEAWAPLRYQEEWDNGGLLLGSYNQEVTGVLTALDVTRENVDWAIAHGVNFIIAHHPLIFRGLKNLAQGTPQTDLIAALQRHEIAVYAAHTSLDIADGGVNDCLAEQIGLTHVTDLVKTEKERCCKLVVYIPGTHAETLRKALGEMGAGHLGNYSHCSYTSSGTGRFLPGQGTSPFIGTVNRLECVAEERIETIIHSSMLSKVMKVIDRVHPYEEPAYDVYPLLYPREVVSLGRIGIWEIPKPFDEALATIKKALQIPVLRYAGKAKSIQRIALCSGAGMDFWQEAKRAKADLYLTSDVKYHEAQDAVNAGLVIVDGHHFYTEQGIADRLQQRLTTWAKEKEISLIVVSDPTRRDVFSFA